MSSQSNPQPTKKTYSAPRLIVYGDVRTLTREAGPGPQKDNGNNARGNRT